MKKLLLLLILLFLVPLVNASLLDNISSYYTFDNSQTQTTVSIDSVGYSNLTITGATTGELGKILQSYSYNGVDDFLTDINYWDTSTKSAISFSVWFKSNGYNSVFPNIVALTDGTQQIYIRLRANNSLNGALQFGSEGNGALDESQNYANGEWHHVVGTIVSGEVGNLYVNGQFINSTAGTIDLSSFSTDDLEVGYSSRNDDYYSGFIDEIAIYDRELNETEVLELYNSGSGLQYPFTENFIINAFNSDATIELLNFSAIINNTLYQTTNGTIITPINRSLGNLFNITVSSDNYVTRLYENYNTSSSLNAFLFLDNEVNFNFFDQSTGQIINNVTGDLISENFGNSYNTTNGSILISSIQPGNYTFFYEADGYETNTYIFNIPLQSSEDTNVSLYMLNTTETNSVLFTVLERGSSGNAIESATVSMDRFVGGNRELVAVKNTDITGRAEFFYEADVAYFFTVSASGYDTKTFSLSPIIFSSYDVLLERSDANVEDNLYLGGVNVIIRPNEYFNNASNNFSITFVDPNSRLTNYEYTLRFNNSVQSSGSGSNAYGGTFSHTLNINGSTLFQFVTVEWCYTRSGQDYCGTETYTVNDQSLQNGLFAGNACKDYGMSFFARLVIAMIILMLFVGLFAYFGGKEIAGLSAIIIMGLFASICFIPYLLALPAIIMIVVYVVTRR